MKITFSVDRKLTKKDLDESSQLAETFFHMQEKPDEIPATKENKEFILNKIPECSNVIYADKKTIGFTFIIPCNKDIMKKFLAKNITENELFEEVKNKINYSNFTAIYLCSSFIKKEVRGRGLAIQGRMKSIKKICEGRKIKPILFAWAQTKEGEKSVKRTAAQIGCKLKLLKQ